MCHMDITIDLERWNSYQGKDLDLWSVSLSQRQDGVMNGKLEMIILCVFTVV